MHFPKSLTNVRRLLILLLVVAAFLSALSIRTMGVQAEGEVAERLGPTLPVGPDFDPIETMFDGPIVQDGSFEAGSPNPFWDEFSTNFGTPLCTVAVCGTGGGTGPRTGQWWAWFGGIGAYEEGSVTQDVTIPAGTATLQFYLEQAACNTAADYLEVTIDGDQVFETTGASSLCGQIGYTLQSVDISAYADGGVHTLEFHSEIFGTGGGITNFFVDDVSIITEGGPTPTATTVPPTATATGGATSIQLSTLESNGGGSTPWLLLSLVGIAGLAGAVWVGARRSR